MSFSKAEVKEKLKSIQFRGPDNLGIKVVDNVTIGHLRLSIIDLDERSNQPFAFENLYITFNGEIYNFLDIKEELIQVGYEFHTTSDTEVLLLGYKHWGVKLLPKLNGMFAFCIYDSEAKKVFCARDRLGVKPFYYYWSNGQLEICSQLRPLSKDKELSDEAISIFLDCTYIPSPYSIFKNVFKLPPGNYMEIDLNNNTLSIKKYWDLGEVSIKNISYENAKAELHELLKDSVKIRLQSDVPIGSFLSGGIDSALVSAIAAKLVNQPINTFTIGFNDPKYDESKLAANYASIIGANHNETICTPDDVMNLIPKLIEVYDEPFADSSALPSLLLNSITKKYVTVALSGDGGDESFLGYNHFGWIVKFKKMLKVPSSIRVITSKLLIFNVLKQRTEAVRNILKVKTINELISGVFIGFISLLNKREISWLSTYSKYENLSDDPIQKTADLNIKLWLENDSNVKVDRASMAYSVEVRSPFLDYRVIEFARSLPVNYRFEKGRTKKILRDILNEYIPEEIFNQPKKGFAVPIGQWIRKELRDEFESNLSDDFLRTIPNLNIKKFKKMFRLHLDNKHDYTSYIWRVYILSKWSQEFGFYKK